MHFLTRILILSLSATTLAAAAFAGPFDTINLEVETPLSGYEKVYIAPVEVDFGDEPIRRNTRDLRGLRPVSEADKTRKAKDLQEDLQREFGKNFELVEAPGDDVLTVKTTLTKLISTRPTIADFNSSNLGLDFRSVYLGGASYEITLREGEQLVGTIEENQTRVGSFNDGQPRVGIWQDTDRSFNRFSRQLARYVKKN